MISICSEILVSCLYTSEGRADFKEYRLTAKDECIFGIPEKLAYLDIISGVVLIIMGALASHHITAVSGASYFIGFGSAQLAVGIIFKLLSVCPCLGSSRWASNGKKPVIVTQTVVNDDGTERIVQRIKISD